VDGLPNPPDFQTFQFGPEWTGLTEVRFLCTDPKYGPGVVVGNSFDNIQVSPIPEPTSSALLLLGVGLVRGCRSKARGQQL
jgi:hypothetical protein